MSQVKTTTKVKWKKEVGKGGEKEIDDRCRMNVHLNVTLILIADLPNTDTIVGVASEQSLAISAPGERNAFGHTFFVVGSHDFWL